MILAVGLTRESLYPGEAEFLGRGVSYCATCDGMLYRGKTVAVIGAGAEARHDADFLEGIGCTVLRFEENLRFEIRGGEKAQTLVAGATEYSVDCVFIIKESIAVTRLVPGLDSSKRGITVTRAMATNVAGVFAAGDCTGKPYQLAKAVGQRRGALRLRIYRCKGEIKMAVSHIRTSEFDGFIAGGAALVDFWATWCGPCRMQAPILEQLDAELGGSVKIGKVDVDEEPELARRFGVMSIPTLIAFKDGKPVSKSVGVTDGAGLKKMLGL